MTSVIGSCPMVRPACLAVLGLVPLAFAIACGNNKEPASPSAPPASAAPPAATEASPAATTGEAAEPAPEPKRRKPFEVYSACADVVTVVFAEDPKAANAGKRTIAPSSSIEGPRNADGNQTVWLLDESGEPLVKVNVTRGMKRVAIGRSCRTLDAR
jgi:hypothetical protein